MLCNDGDPGLAAAAWRRVVLSRRDGAVYTAKQTPPAGRNVFHLELQRSAAHQTPGHHRSLPGGNQTEVILWIWIKAVAGTGGSA